MQDGVDGSCSTGVEMRHSAAVTRCDERSHPMQITTVGLDLAKNVFHAHGMNDGRDGQQRWPVDGSIAFFKLRIASRGGIGGSRATERI